MAESSIGDIADIEKEAVAAMERLMVIRNEEIRPILEIALPSFVKRMKRKLQWNALQTRSHQKREINLRSDRVVINYRKNELVSSPAAFVHKKKFRKSILRFKKPRRFQYSRVGWVQNEFDETHWTW